MLMKIVFKDVVHRHQVDDFQTFTYDDLLKTVRTLTGLDGPFTIQYTDNEMECITIGSSAELIDAFEMAEQDGRSALRVFVCPVSGPGPLSVITTTSENSAVVVLPSSNRVAGEESDFGDSDFEFVEEDGDLQARIAERSNHSSAENIVVQTTNGSDSFFTDSQETSKCKIAPPELVPVTLSEAIAQVSEATTLNADQVTSQMSSLSITKEAYTPMTEVVPPVMEEEEAPASLNALTSETVAPPSSPTRSLDESKVNEIAEQVFREVAETKMKQLSEALAVIFDNEAHSESTDIGDVPLRKAVARVFSKEDAVTIVQKALADPLIKNMVLDMCAAECSEQSIWEACSPHMVKALELSSNVLKECPQLFTLIPPIVAASMRLLNAKKSETNVSETLPRASTEPVIHKRVQCNSCLEKNPRTTSYIAGSRFKSAIVEDFDLCEVCEATGKYNQSHGPFLKIYTPSQAPEALFCVIRGNEPTESMKKEERAFRKLAKKVKEANPSETHTFKEVVVDLPQQHGQLNTGDFTDMMAAHVDAAAEAALSQEDVIEGPGETFAEFVAQQVRATSAAAVADATMASLDNNATALSVTSTNGCPGKHLLKRFLTPHVGFVCDKCGARPGTYDVMFGCRICNFDVCSACYKGKSPAVEPQALAPAGYTATSDGPNNVRVVQKPQAKFVADISLPDGSIVSPGSKLSKTWRLRNTGTVTWPKGTRIVHVGGDSLGLSTQISIDAVDPGHVVDVSVPLTAPSRPGRVVGYFRLMTPDNQRFGHRIWVDVTVDGTLGEQIAATVAKPFIEIGQDIVSRVQEETMKLYPRVPPSVSSGVTAISSANGASAASPAEPIPKPTNPEIDERIKKYEIELTTLCDMGFMDVQRNSELLAAANGDLETVIGQLMGST